MSRVTKSEAIVRLIDARCYAVAHRLIHWSNRRGNDWGWDGWLRGHHPDLVTIVWSAHP